MAGATGKSFQDREKSAQVRNLALSQIAECLEHGTIHGKPVEKRFSEALLLKLAGTVLPRLNEHGGEGGDPIKHSITVKFG